MGSLQIISENDTSKKPSWLRVKAPGSGRFQELSELLRERRLHTVCSSAACPNVGECWSSGTATFMILGNECTRACRFCDVKTSARPNPIDLDEPGRVAEAALLMNLKHVVITSVTRDDAYDGGAMHFVRTIEAVREVLPKATLEVLTPDFLGNLEHLKIVQLLGKPEIFNHNIETIRELTPQIRSGGQYDRSLYILREAKKMRPETLTKSSIMLGLGETDDQVKVAIEDLKKNSVDIVTLGQYLRPSKKHHELKRYAHPDSFKMLKDFAENLGFSHVESGPLVRSSYHAERAVQ